MISIKPCRFCDSTAARVEFRDNKGKGEGPRFSAFVRCGQCYARGPRLRSINAGEDVLKMLAIEAWNGDGPIASFEAEK